MNKLPIFLHIPKSGGTYVLSWAMSMFRFWTNNNTLQQERCVISVKYNDSTILRVLACVKDDIIFAFNSQHQYEYIMDIDTFLCKLDKIEIFFMMIEADGFFAIKDKTIESICVAVQKSPVYYMTLRDNFSRCQSLYNYLNSENSNHEKSHGCIKAVTFENYLSSDQLEDSWLIRALIDISNDQQISEQHFDSACDMLDRVRICDIKAVDSLIDDMFDECYSITRQDVLPHQIILNKNETNTDKISFKQLDDEAQNIFLKRTEFDRKLYDRYCK